MAFIVGRAVGDGLNETRGGRRSAVGQRCLQFGRVVHGGVLQPVERRGVAEGQAVGRQEEVGEGRVVVGDGQAAEDAAAVVVGDDEGDVAQTVLTNRQQATCLLYTSNMRLTAAEVAWQVARADCARLICAPQTDAQAADVSAALPRLLLEGSSEQRTVSSIQYPVDSICLLYTSIRPPLVIEFTCRSKYFE